MEAKASGLADFEKQWIRGEVAAIHALGIAVVDSWLAERSHRLGFGELAMPASDPDGIGQRLVFGLAVLGNGPRSGHGDIGGVREIWEHLATTRTHPLIGARAARNLWRQRCAAVPHEYGRQAIVLFEAVADGPAGRACERAAALVEALEIAAEMRSAQDLVRLVDSALNTLDVELARCNQLTSDATTPRTRPGTSERVSMAEWAGEAIPELDATQHHGACLYLLRGLAALESGRSRAAIDHERLVRMADQLAELVGGRDLWSRHLLEVRVGLARGDQDERKRVVAQHIEWFRTGIAGADGPRRYVTLMHCEQLARDTGLTELADNLRVELQGWTLDGLALQAVRVAVTVPHELVEAARGTVEAICSADTLSTRLRRLALDGVTCWRNSTVRRDQSLPDRPVADSLPSVTVGHHSVPARRSGAGEVDERAERARWDAAAIGFEVDLVVMPALTILVEAPPDSIVEAMTAIGERTGLLDHDRATSCAEALRDWGEHRTDAALHSVVPRIEHVVRRAAELRGLPVITPTDGTSRGGHDTLGQVLDTLAGHADPNLLLHLRTVLVDDAGLNLRNDVAHGDVARGDQRISAIAIHTLLLAVFGLALES